MLHRPMILFADVAKHKNAGRNIGRISRLTPDGQVARSRYRNSNRIPKALLRRPVTTARIAQVAKCFQNILGRSFANVTWSRAVPAPPGAERKPRRMRPRAILQPRDWHEIGASHLGFFAFQFLWKIGSGNCSELNEVRPVFCGG